MSGTAARRRSSPREHWVLFTLLLLVLAFLFTLHAIVSGATGAEEVRPIGNADRVPAAVREGGPVIDARADTPSTLRPRERVLVLTFDDGPDPDWTPALLDVLDAHSARATFFVTGVQAAKYPGLVREIVDRGHEVGHHTATHVDLRGLSPWRMHLEMRTTDLTLVHAMGLRTSLVRPPYSATPDAVDNLAWQAARRLGEQGRLTVLSDLDSRDWQLRDVGKIVRNSTPRTSEGAVVLMHDGGGDRAITVAAVAKLVPTLQEKGWRFQTVSQSIGATGTSSEADLVDRAAGAALVGAVHAAGFGDGVIVLMVAATILALLRTLYVLVATGVHVRRVRRHPDWPVDDPVTVIVPAYNEEVGIAATVRSILASHHPVEVIVVDDGSTDRTPDIVRGMRSPRLRFIRQRNAGKAAALNTGLAAARTELIVMVDGDTVLEPGTVGAIVAQFADPAIGAVSGNAKVGNRRGLLGRWQHIEYVIGFNLDRRMYDVLQCMPTVPGAIGAFRRSAVLAVGGVPEDTLAEDTDLTMALERAGWRVTYAERAVAWTEAPATLGQLWKQRYRWCYGTLQAIWKHRRAAFQRGPAGKLGRRGLPYLLLFQVLLPALAPVVDVAVVVGLFTGDAGFTGLIWLAFLLLQAIPGVIAFRLDGERLAPLLALPLQQLVYRQLMYLVVIQSVATAIAGAHLPWHKLERRGQTAPEIRAG